MLETTSVIGNPNNQVIAPAIKRGTVFLNLFF